MQNKRNIVQSLIELIFTSLGCDVFLISLPIYPGSNLALSLFSLVTKTQSEIEFLSKGWI